jgi:hypothetical protein
MAIEAPISSTKLGFLQAQESGFWSWFGANAAQIARGQKRSSLSLLKESVMLRLGAGRLSFEEYMQLRLFDDQLYAATDKSGFAGLKASQKIWLQANYRVDLFGLVTNKISADILLATHGFPILTMVALFHEQVGIKCPFLLRNDEDLRDFLTTSDNYPLFGKPLNGYRSIGSASIDRYDAASDMLITTTGLNILVDTFISFLRDHSASGYLFQKRVSPHARVREICGDRLATVRLLTIVRNGAPKILRGCWKIPAGVNAADNFWRPGNLLAQLDLENGRVLRVVRSDGASNEEITHHPDTGARILGTFVPNWPEVLMLALEGAKVLEDIPLVGWDIAPVDSGAIVVEPNINPDFNLHQIADRRGILDDTLREFLQERKKHAAKALRTAKRLQA